ncbi:unnamed protein product, partial [Mesorhabditis belari]|uniref:Serine/threonine specific protein phosphatases domain-containing protein n=1 Tax=Mesorhabditis belari TaxID=2138241 RepID=A0AAF3FF85_9BILA
MPFILFFIAHIMALRSTTEDILPDFCHDCEYPHFNGPRPDMYTTLSCVRQLDMMSPRERVQYYVRDNPICIALVVFEGLRPLYTLRAGVPASSLPEECYKNKQKGGFGVDNHWQAEVINHSNYDKLSAIADADHEKNETRRYVGALMCCGTPICNSDDVEFFQPMRIGKREVKHKDWTAAMPILIVISIFTLTLWPFFSEVAELNRSRALEKIEKPCTLTDEWYNCPQPVTLYFRETVCALFRGDKSGYRQLHIVLGGLNRKRGIAEDKPSEKFSAEPPTEIATFWICDTKFTKVGRKMSTRLEELGARLIEHGPFEFDFNVLELADLFDKATQLLDHEPSLLALPANVVVVGSIEGNYVQLFRIFQKWGWPPLQRYLFLGGLTLPDVPESLETFCLLLALKLRHPHFIYFLRGVSETDGLNLYARFPERLANVISQMTNEIHARFPLAAVVADRIFCVYGGLAPKISLRSILDIKKGAAEVKRGTMAANLIFSMPDPTETHKIPGGRGWLFGPNVVEAFIKKHQNIRAIIRSRNIVDTGINVCKCNDIPIYTIHSSPDQPNEEREGHRSAAVLNINSYGVSALRFSSHKNFIGVVRNVKNKEKQELDPTANYRKTSNIKTL